MPTWPRKVAIAPELFFIMIFPWLFMLDKGWLLVPPIEYEFFFTFVLPARDDPPNILALPAAFAPPPLSERIGI